MFRSRNALCCAPPHNGHPPHGKDGPGSGYSQLLSSPTVLWSDQLSHRIPMRTHVEREVRWGLDVGGTTQQQGTNGAGSVEQAVCEISSDLHFTSRSANLSGPGFRPWEPSMDIGAEG